MMAATNVFRASFLWPVMLTVLWLAALGWGFSQSITAPSDWGWAARSFADTVTKYVLWTAGWAWFTYTLQGQSRLSGHITIVALAGLIDELALSLAVPWLFFALGWSWPLALNQLLFGALVITTSIFNLRLACKQIDRRLLGLWVLAASVGGSLYGLKTWGDLNEKDAAKKLPYAANIYPAYWVKTPELGIDDGLRELWGAGKLLGSDN